jgi:hypothetical protein
MKSVPWVWVLITALVTFFIGPKVVGAISAKTA